MFIDHDRCAGGSFLEYIGVFCVKLSQTRAHAMFTRSSSLKKAKVASGSAWRVGHVLVLVFATTRRHLALRVAARVHVRCGSIRKHHIFGFFLASHRIDIGLDNRVSERLLYPDAILCYISGGNTIEQNNIYAIISHISLTNKRKSTL